MADCSSSSRSPTHLLQLAIRSQLLQRLITAILIILSTTSKSLSYLAHVGAYWGGGGGGGGGHITYGVENEGD